MSPSNNWQLRRPYPWWLFLGPGFNLESVQDQESLPLGVKQDTALQNGGQPNSNQQAQLRQLADQSSLPWAEGKISDEQYPRKELDWTLEIIELSQPILAHARGRSESESDTPKFLEISVNK